MNKTDYIKLLGELLKKKIDCLRRILVLTERQKECINEDGIESLERLISEKQVVIDEINRIDLEFERIFSDFKADMGVERLEDIIGLNAQEVIELKKCVSEIMTLVGKISAIEKQNSEMANSLLDEISGKIKKINQSKMINNAYKSKVQKTVSYFIDKKN